MPSITNDYYFADIRTGFQACLNLKNLTGAESLDSMTGICSLPSDSSSTPLSSLISEAPED